ncbi:MAG TPA: polysaccharide biosynthesis/export family protein [Vicinamibacterales bacterium]|nr:polysaccharide biosynthesis/export family protein [Vicinamibacterales bacterium]
MSLQRLAIRVAIGCLSAALVSGVIVQAQSAPTKPSGSKATPGPTPTPAPPAGVTPPADYVIGPDDALTVNFWRDKDMSADVIVRPDGKITLPLINEIAAAGLTTEQLRATVVKASMKFLNEEPTVNIIVRQINSRRVYITGQVGKSGPYPLTEHLTVVQLISIAGGVAEYAKTERIQIVRTENGQQKSYFFNYKDFMKGKPAALKQNIELKIGDTVIVP